MGSLIRAFTRGIRKQDFVLFYFAGDGMQYKEENYLLTIDAIVKSLKVEFNWNLHSNSPLKIHAQ